MMLPIYIDWRPVQPISWHTRTRRFLFWEWQEVWMLKERHHPATGWERADRPSSYDEVQRHGID